MLGHWPPVPLRPRTRSHWPVRVSARSAGVDPSAAGVARGHALSRLPRIMMPVIHWQARCSNNPSRPGAPSESAAAAGIRHRNRLKAARKLELPGPGLVSESS